MSRIPQGELERIKRDTDLAALVRSRGVELKAHGKDLIGLCPFHDDHEPSLVVTPERNLWHCLGACSTGGSVIDWVMKAEGVSFRHAAELLRHGVVAPVATGEPPKRSTVRRLPTPVEYSASDQELLLQVVDYYHETLLISPEAQDYLKARGIDHPDAVRHFKLGYANRSLGLRLPDNRRADGLRVRHRLAKLGIIRASGHEHFSGSLVIPVLDLDGHVTEIYGRKLRDDLRPGTVYHTYLPGPHRGVFNPHAFRAAKEIILCEALIDALTFWRHGFYNVTASYGVNGFTDEHLETFKAHAAERVLIAYDHDEAGDRAAGELSRRLAGEGITSFRVRFPHGMDANEYACKVTPAAQALALLLRSATYLAGPLASPSLPALPSPVPELVVSVEPSPPDLPAGSPADETAPTAPASVDHAAQDPPSPLAASPPAIQPNPALLPLPGTPDAAPPAPPRPIVPADVGEQEIVIRFDGRRWRVRGLAKNSSFEQLRVNVLVALDGASERYHLDTLDLYSAKQRAAFIRQAAAELALKEDAIKRDLGLVLLKLEELQEAQIRKALEPADVAVVMSDGERHAALELLRDPRLLERILADFERCGVVGEETNKLVGYLAALTRKLDEPLAIIIQSSTAAGKSALMKAVLALVPEEERVFYSAMTGQSLFYMGSADLAHKILAIAEEEGAERASYPLKLLQSEGELSIASTGKDPATGMLVTHTYQVRGPVMIFLTTTAIDLDEELRNRCLVLTVDEDREQTRAIHRLQRERRTLAGIVARRDKAAIVKLHQNAQRLLLPLAVANPYAERLTFLDSQTRTRRDHDKYLTLIEAVALVHQHQREKKTLLRDGRPEPYIEVTLSDIEIANRLAHEVLGRTLDELPPQTRRFLVLLDEMVTAACREKRALRAEHRFSRADIRHALGWSYDQVRVHLERLVELEYVLVHRGSRGQSFVYELLWDGKGTDGAAFCIGLIDPASLRQSPGPSSTTQSLGGEKGGFGGSLGGHLAPIGVGLGGTAEGEKRNGDGHPGDKRPDEAENALLPGAAERSRSYRRAGRTAAEPASDQPLLPFAAGAKGRSS
jgi:DNA primase catalytic core